MTEIKKQIEKNKKKLKGKILNFDNLNKLIGFSIVIILGFYIASINDMVVKGFRLQELRKEKNSIVDINKELENKRINRESYSEVSKRVEGLKMIAVNNIEYIEMVNGAVAKK
jgi:hypothetical protein